MKLLLLSISIFFLLQGCVSLGCKFEDGMYPAVVEYYNPRTGYSNTYALNIAVEDCKVKLNRFPEGGWLDESRKLRRSYPEMEQPPFTPRTEDYLKSK